MRRHPSGLLRQWRRHQAIAITTIALVVGICGVWLATNPATYSVGISAKGVDVDGALLTPTVPQAVRGVRVFTGPASLAITAAHGATSRAGAAMMWGGRVSTGRCVLVLVESGASEACRFTIGPATVTAADTFDSRTNVWHRHYADGVDIAIAIPAGSPLIPIPFPLGR